mmetsp:Transcript_19521/g.50401  ORF Transcript_19521/g.50401 Transcript_19521/m.50401 type:complete len:221 (-) Transcript_19521:181-843(-)
MSTCASCSACLRRCATSSRRATRSTRCRACTGTHTTSSTSDVGTASQWRSKGRSNSRRSRTSTRKGAPTRARRELAASENSIADREPPCDTRIRDGQLLTRHALGCRYAAAEMKHGPIALIDEFMPVVVIAPRSDATYDKLRSNIQEVLARRGSVIAITESDNNDLDADCEYVIKIPHVSDFLTPILSVLPLQLMSYYIADMRGCNVDQPRNLAKSVTVE